MASPHPTTCRGSRTSTTTVETRCTKVETVTVGGTTSVRLVVGEPRSVEGTTREDRVAPAALKAGTGSVPPSQGLVRNGGTGVRVRRGPRRRSLGRPLWNDIRPSCRLVSARSPTSLTGKADLRVEPRNETLEPHQSTEETWSPRSSHITRFVFVRKRVSTPIGVLRKSS